MIGDWWSSESGVREDVRKRETEIAELPEIGFALLGEGMEILEKKKLDPWELVVAFAITQLHNTLRAARELAFAGYGVQSLALARLVDDFLVLLWWIPNHRDQAEPWLDPKKKRRSAGEMAKEVFAQDAETGARHKEIRESLHRFAHQDALAFTAIYQPDEGSGAGIQIGPWPDGGQLRGAAYYLLTFLALGAHTMTEIVEAPGDVRGRVAEYVRRVDEWRDRTDHEEHARLTALGVELPPLDQM